MSKLDYTLPISALVRESTKEAHDNVEHSPTAVAMLRGELQYETYIQYLMTLWHIYNAIERGLERHSSHPVLEPTYNPSLLSRAGPLEADISYLLKVPESSWKSHSLHKALIASPHPALSGYVARLEEISNSSDPSPLLAHAYVRYLGDLSGGQQIKHTIAKAYDIDATGPGLSFYNFKELKSSKPASLGEMKRIKEWYRDGMDKGVGDDVNIKVVVAAEASEAFQYTHALFDALAELPTPEKLKPTGISPLASGTVVAETPAKPEKTYTFSQVATVILAACLGHFILVVGGFTGKQWSAKVLAFEEWYSSLFA